MAKKKKLEHDIFEIDQEFLKIDERKEELLSNITAWEINIVLQKEECEKSKEELKKNENLMKRMESEMKKDQEELEEL